MTGAVKRGNSNVGVKKMSVKYTAIIDRAKILTERDKLIFGTNCRPIA